MAKESFGTVAKRRLLGLAYLVVLAGLVSLSVAAYNKAFTPVDMVTLHTDHTGNQLLNQSDVKIRGIIVGSVRSVKSTGDGAMIKIALQPGRTKIIPSNVSAQILPKTLFGEQYVSLVIPPDPVGHIRAGDTIPQDRSEVALETERVLGDFLPLIQAVRPAELNATLTAVATALSGRGAMLGNTLKNLDAYLRQINPQVPQLVDDLSKLGNLSDELNKAAPDLVATLNNFQTGARTVIDKKAALDQILTQADATSNLFNSFLQENQTRLITIVSTTDSIYRLLNQYSPEFGCMLTGLSKYFDRANKGITHNQIQLSAQLYIATPNYGAYKPENKPFYVTGVGPNCLGIPNPQVPFVVPGPLRCISDGATVSGDKSCETQNAVSGRDQQAVGSAAENAQVNTILATGLNTTPDKVPGVATLLLAPSLRGQVVTVK